MQSEDQTIEQKEKSKKKRIRLLRKIIYSLFWVIIISYAFGINIMEILLKSVLADSYFIFVKAYNIYIYGFILLIILIFFKVHKIIQWLWGFILLPFYIIFIFLPKYTFKSIYQIIKVIKNSSTITKSFRFRVAFYLLFIFAIVSIIKQPTEYILMMSMAILFIHLLHHYIKRFYYVSFPMRFINMIINVIFKICDMIRENVILKSVREWQTIDSETDAFSSKRAESLNNAWVYNRVLYRFAKYLEREEGSKLIAVYFIFIISCTFIYTVLVFALEYHALILIQPDSFVGLDTSNFLNTIYFSFHTLIMVNYGDITPVSGLSKLLVAMESLFGIVIGVILFFIFTTIVLDKYRKDIDRLIYRLLQEEVVIKQLMKKEFNKGIKDLFIELSNSSDQMKEIEKKQQKFLMIDDNEEL